MLQGFRPVVQRGITLVLTANDQRLDAVEEDRRHRVRQRDQKP